MSEDYNVYRPDENDGDYDANIYMMDSLSTSLNELKVENLAKDPEAIRLLLIYIQATLRQLKSSEIKVDHLEEENNQLKLTRENLKVQVVDVQSRANVSWLEIPIAIFSGFAINMLTTDFKDPVGWMLIILSTVMLVYIRGEQMLGWINKFRGNDVTD